MNAAIALGLILFALVLGVFSSVLFVWQWIGGSATQLSSSILFLSVAAVFTTIFFYLKARIPRSPARVNRSWKSRVLLFLYLIGAVGYAGISVVQHAKTLPHGPWDAFSVWNLHARILYRAHPGEWLGTLSRALSAYDYNYPLLLPGLVSGAWSISGADKAVIPSTLSILFAVLSIGILSCSVNALAADDRGWFAGLLLVATPSFLVASVYQMADIPNGLYILCAVVLLQFADAWPPVRRVLLVLAGLSAGCAAWTKREGLLFLVAILGSQLVAFALMRAWRQLAINLKFIALGIVPMLALILGFKTLTPGGTPIQTFQHVASVERYSQIASGFYDQAKGFGGTWHRAGLHPLVLVAIFVLIYATPAIKIRATSLMLVLLLVSMGIGYAFVYTLSAAENVSGYILGSLDRLLLQLWPAFLFVLATFGLSTFADTASNG